MTHHFVVTFQIALLYTLQLKLIFIDISILQCAALDHKLVNLMMPNDVIYLQSVWISPNVNPLIYLPTEQRGLSTKAGYFVLSLTQHNLFVFVLCLVYPMLPMEHIRHTLKKKVTCHTCSSQTNCTVGTI